MMAAAEIRPFPPVLEAERLRDDAARLILGGLLIDPKAWDRLDGAVCAADFHRRCDQLIFGAITALVERGEAFDAVIVAEWLANHGELKDVGGLDYLGQLAQEVYSTVNIASYAHVLRSTSIERAEASGWNPPTPLPNGLPPVPEFDYELLPGVIRHRVADIAERMQCSPDFPAVGMMVMLAGLVGRRLTVRPKKRDDWTVIPNLWGMIIGRPGLMKTPALDDVFRPMRALQARAAEEYRRTVEDYEAEEIVRDQRKRVAKDKIRAALKKGDSGEASDLAHEATAAGLGAPVCRRWLVNDSTTEKLGELLAENPNGLLLYRDELTGFFKTLERQGHEADRAFYLEAWNGDNGYTYDRIGRGTIHIESLCLSVLGSIQPGPLSTLVRGMRGNGDDGLLQRFQLAIWPDQPSEWRNIDRLPDYHARDQIDVLIARLADMEPQTEPFRFDDAGQELFDAWRAELEGRLRGNMHPMIEAHLAKYRSLVPALALLCHVVEPSVSFVGPISEVCVARAIAWSEYLEVHANRIYAPAVSPDMDAARALAARIEAGDIAERFALRDIYRAGWSGLATRDDAAAAVSVLLDFDWLREDREETSGRTRTIYTIHPSLWRQS